MDFGYAFGYAFKDPDWFKKLAIMGLVTLIPVLGQFVLIGWMMALMRRVINRQEPALLPDLDFSAQLSDGFRPLWWALSIKRQHWQFTSCI